MRIYWWIMTGLLMFPWVLAIVPSVLEASRRVSFKQNRCRNLRWARTVVLIAMLSNSVVAFAGDPVATPGERLQDGVRDLTTGWTAFFQTVGTETTEHGPATGLLVASLEGTNRALQRTLRGAYETATFLLPVPRPQPMASEPGNLLEVRF